ncbi:beta-lactam-binding protein with PASTA domain [Dysgonomonas hofstadii]|uniref:Beta-lactam-binding protein with PASTA domain n=1 Tax=Dysgonomonas hofstadii TaxID=637886 RepID=A0A840CPS8_9BACT|nr:PASTA domain-containing protein [Dysgonomonas hofstadii]MBB4036689.1 beta-lactam-binding protein with PASTA domain [Dysgonomonas hofstadii]
MKDEKKKNIVIRLLSNIYVKNILIMVIVFVALVAVVLFALNIYTKHDKSSTVPSVKGLQMEEAGSILASAGLDYEISDSIFQTGGTPGAVLEQIPKGESKVKEGRTVYLIVQAKGVQMVPVPELKDFSRRQAEAQLNSLGFERIMVEEVASPYAGIVISVSYKGQELRPNQKVPKGATLKMVVGAGGESLEDSIENFDVKVEDSFFD